MALSFDELLTQLKDGPITGGSVSITSNQTNGLSMYATGNFSYSPGGTLNDRFPIYRWPYISSDSLTATFSDRLVQADHSPGGGFGVSSQRFDAKQSEKATLHIGFPVRFGKPNDAFTASIEFVAYQGWRLTIPLQRMEDCLVGVGPAIGDGTRADNAIYTVGFELGHAAPN